MKHRRIITMLLCMLLLASACGKGASDNESKTENTVAQDTETVPAETEITRENTPDNLPSDLKFNGETVVFHVRGDQSCIEDFYVEELTGEPVNDATYQRNITVSDRLNVNIAVAVGESWENYTRTVSDIRASIQAGDGSYDAVAGWSACIPSLSVEGLFLDLQTIPYLDLEMPWWNQSCRTELVIANHLYFMTGDITKLSILPMYVYVFNQKVAQDQDIENPYTVVNEGRWTLDYVRAQTSDMANDLNGDGKMDETDVYGLATFYPNPMDCYMQSARVSMIDRDEDDLPVLNVDKERMATLVEKVYALCFENPGAFVDSGDSRANSVAMFKEDRALYTTLTMQFVGIELTEMESDFGILPFPKFDESQKEYGTRVQDALTLLSIPIDCKKTDVTGAVMEAIAAENYRKVTPALFDVTMKRKYSRDPESAAMIDLIQQSVLINFECIYNGSIGTPWDTLRVLMSKKSSDFASYWAKQEKTVEKALSKAVEKIRSIDEQ